MATPPADTGPPPEVQASPEPASTVSMTTVVVVEEPETAVEAVGSEVERAEGVQSKASSPNDLKSQPAANGGPRAPSLTGSEVHLAQVTSNSPRPSLCRQESTVTTSAHEVEKPKDYLFIAILSCFCPMWPVNIVGFVYSIMILYSGLSYKTHTLHCYTCSSLDTPVLFMSFWSCGLQSRAKDSR
ncbi:hypothetical protein FKM82_028000 [Ascaphus truei]